MQISPWVSDLRHAVRTLRRAPGFTLTAVLMLGLAMGALSALFSTVQSVLLTPLPFAEPERLFYVSGEAPGAQFSGELGVADEMLVHFSERSQLFSSAALYNDFTNSLRFEERVERIPMSAPSSDLFATLGVAPALGRLPNADEREVVVISDRLWTDWFARDPAVIGKQVTLFREQREVIAVMPPDFRFPTEATLLWLTRPVTAAQIDRGGRFQGTMVLRAKPGVTADALQRELTALAAEVPERFGGSDNYLNLMKHFRVIVQPLEEQLLGPIARPLWLLVGAAALLLVIACVNLANLLMVRTEARHRELALRRAMGADRGHLLRLQLAEALVIAAMAGALAMLLSVLLLPLIVAMAPEGVPRLDRAAIGFTSLAFTAGIALVSGLLCGLLPAWRGASPNLDRLRDGGRGHTGGHHRLRHAMVVAQTALALMLVIGAGLLLRSAQALHQVDPGYDVADVFTFQFAPEQASLNNPEAWSQFHQNALTRFAALPGVQSVGLVENIPLNEGTATDSVRLEGAVQLGDDRPRINVTYSAGDYFRSMGITRLAGRDFDSRDHAGSGNLIVSRTAAEKLWPGQDAIGKRLQRLNSEEWETVIGVVEDVLQENFWSPAEPLVYAPLRGPNVETSWRVSSPAYVIKTSRADGISAEVRALIRELAPEAPMYRVFTLQRLATDSMATLTFTLLTLGLAALLALALGAIGLFGVLSYVVAERTREIGIRMALGAPSKAVRNMIVLQGLQVVTVGVVIGLLVASVSSQALGDLLFGVSALDGLTFGAMSVAMLILGAIASYLPARRASNVDPMVEMRSE